MLSRSPLPPLPSELVNYRVAWVPLARSIELASARLRCLLPLGVLRRCGLQTEVYDPDRRADYDAFIFQKAYEEAHLELAAELHAAGRPILVDLCDHHFHVPSGDPNLVARAARLRRLLACAALVSVSTPELARALDLEQFVLVEDYPDFARPRALAEKGAVLSRALGRRLGRPLRLVWFGNAGSYIEGFGLPDLERIVPNINAASSRCRLELTVISNNEKLAGQALRAARFPFFYEAWSYGTFHQRLRRQDVCLIPITRNPFTDCKTANRVALALSLGLPVICDCIPSYEPFRPFVLEGDWEKSIGLCAASHGAMRARALAARPWLFGTFTENRVARQWFEALAALRRAVPVPAALFTA